MAGSSPSQVRCGTGIRRSTAGGLALIMMAALLALPLAGRAAAEETTVITAPYPRASTSGNAIANRETGLVSALSVHGNGWQIVPGGKASVGIDHRLTDNASAIDYTIVLTKNGTIGSGLNSSTYVYVRVEARLGSSHEVTEVPWTPGPQVLSLTLSAPDGGSFSAGSLASISVEVSAITSSCHLMGGCQLLSFGWISAGVAQAVVNSVVATTDPAPEPQPTPTPTTPLELEAHGYKDQGLQKADLIWSGGPEDINHIDVYRDGEVIAAKTENDGAFTDHIDRRGKGTYVYRVCEADTTTCSNEATVEF